MKKLSVIIIVLLLLCGCKKESFDGKDRPSSCGKLQVVEDKLCDAKGNPVMLRGISNPGVSISELYTTNETYKSISEVMGCNVIRLALYTKGMGIFGYCTSDYKDRYKQDIYDAVNYAKENDMYVIVDWHILDDKTPMKYLDDAKTFFEEVSAKLKNYNNVLYEICNEPNHCDWDEIKEYADIIIPIIRNNDPKSVIIVGTPTWSQDVDVAANDPLDYDNIMYTLHFYSATHKEELRNRVQVAIDKGLPIFVSEFGCVASNGGFPRDLDEADIWIDFLENNNISYVMWNFSK